MFRLFLVCLVLGYCVPAFAQDWRMLEGDVPLSQDEVQEMTNGQTLTFYDNGQAKFSVGGSYSYTYANNGGTAFGQFDVSTDGRVCIDFANGFSRCDLFVQNSRRLVMLTEKGERYPIRPK